MSIDPPPEGRGATAPLVAAVVTASDAEVLGPCLEAVAAQVYGAAQVFVVGGDDEVRRITGEHEATWRPNVRAAIDSIGTEFTYVWALRERARPRPHALLNLVQDTERVGASVAGSKILDAAQPTRLVSVGYATDVFCAPFTGLEDDELDQQQYDVIRDVSSVAGVSMLIRRDLYRGLRGIDPHMAPSAAAIDFCNRARLRGARVVAIPSSEVVYEVPTEVPDWRERAGEMRSMLKVYSPLTLLWAVPLALFAGIAESVVGIFLGRFPLPGFVAGAIWNLVVLPKTIGLRFQARRGRQVGDEELFRYQVNGSARLREMWDDALDKMRERFPEGVLSGFSDAVEAGQQRIRHPAFFVGMLVVAFGLIATREVWTERLPIGGLTLPPPDSAIDTLGAYAGGWNPAGFGSPEVLLPSVGAVAVVQLLLLGKAGLATALLTVASFIGGAFGTGRLLRVWGIGSVPGYLAGAVLMAGPAMVALGETGLWMAIPAVAALPWAVSSALRPWPRNRMEQMGRLAATGLFTGLAAVFLPPAGLVPVVALTLWALVGTGERWWAAGRALFGLVIAAPLVAPWVLYADLPDFVAVGSPAFWDPGVIVAAAAAVVFLGVALAGGPVLSSIATWGGLVAAAGAVVARTGDLGAGVHVEAAGLAAASLGLAVVVGSGLEFGSRRKALRGWRSAAGHAAGAAGVLFVAATLLLAGPGRAGLPDDTLTGVYDFAASEDTSPGRILAFGPDLPGTERTIEGLGYRVFDPPFPYSWEAYLNEPRLGDEALHGFLESLLEGRERRAGNALAEFGIAWVVFTEPSPLQRLLESQLDLFALRSLDFPVYRNEVPAAPAVEEDGTRWLADGTGYRSPDGRANGSLRIADNADYRWGPGAWEQVDWANQLSGAPAAVKFEAYTPRRLMAFGAGVWFLALVAGMILGRKRS
jgi:hypothetical protein